MFKIMHIIGIGGIGMSALAEVAHARGIQIQGSDTSKNPNIERLKKLDIKIFNQHKVENIKGADCVVYSTAISADNPERQAAANEAEITLWHRADMLAWLMEGKRTITISGTHGKTTTTALVGAVLTEAGFDPTIINGGIMPAYKSNVRLGKSDWLIVEGDESDGTFTRLPSDYALITNIDREHLNHYGSYENLQKAFAQFMADAKLASVPPQNISEAKNIQFTPTGTSFQTENLKVELPLLGEHNIQNALGAIKLARVLKIPDEVIATALKNFQGVGRRFQPIAQRGDSIFYDDYAHHPSEIQATIKAVKQIKGARVIALVQPHRYTRLADLFNEFVASLNEADIIWLTPVFAAGEAPKKPDSQSLYDRLKEAGKEVHFVETAKDIAVLIKAECRAGDRVIAMGAGSVGNLLKEALDVAE